MVDNYRKLYQAWEKERSKESLQNIPDEFINDMKHYVSSINKAQTDASNIRDRIIEKEREYATKLLNGLIQNRLNKIVILELQGKPINAKALTPGEQHLHANLRHLLSAYLQGTHLETQTPKISKDPTPKKQVDPPKPFEIPEIELVVVRFLQQLPAIMGIDMKAYGPFSPEDVASIPKQNAVNLVKRGIAKLVEVEP